MALAKTGPKSLSELMDVVRDMFEQNDCELLSIEGRSSKGWVIKQSKSIYKRDDRPPPTPEPYENDFLKKSE